MNKRRIGSWAILGLVFMGALSLLSLHFDSKYKDLEHGYGCSYKLDPQKVENPRLNQTLNHFGLGKDDIRCYEVTELEYEVDNKKVHLVKIHGHNYYYGAWRGRLYACAVVSEDKVELLRSTLRQYKAFGQKIGSSPNSKYPDVNYRVHQDVRDRARALFSALTTKDQEYAQTINCKPLPFNEHDQV